MAAGELLPDNRPLLSLGALDELVGLHLEARLRLQGSAGIVSTAHIDGDADGLVLALLHYARLGVIAEAEAKSNPQQPVRNVVADARRRWTLELGFA